MNAVYNLTAVLMHKGNSAHKGHYIAHIKDTNTNTWYKCNDDEIERIGGKDLQLGNDEDDMEGKVFVKKKLFL